ncbi:PKD domain-containing protein [Thiolinea disciformis]|uniref:PKD domain-containing protein n=1 Tax=Thiolinea disciformis TaxID=125614 RepID=UPI000375BDC8|nr:PKD domain-containing protein [Thiolinea disciformis]
MKKKGLWFTLLLSIMLTACGGGSDSSSSTKNNTAPIAKAGADQTIDLGKTVNLDASASSDPDNDSLGYTWEFVTKPSGSSISLSNANTVNPSFVPDKVGTYTLNLKVDDGAVYSPMDSVDIFVKNPDLTTLENRKPIADAGADQSLAVASLGLSSVTITSLSNDPDGDALTYKWSILKQPNSNAKLSNTDQKTVLLTPDVIGVYELSLDVSDGKLLASDTVKITITQDNQAPIAKAGADQVLAVKILGTESINLMSASTDPEGDVLTYKWSILKQPTASTNAKLLNSDQQIVSLIPDVVGVYELQLAVKDGQNTSTDSVQITVSKDNQIPIARVSDQEVMQNTLVTLDASASSDANNDPLTYHWLVQSMPEGSTATLSNSSTKTPSFTPDRVGNYVFQLKVSDGTANSAATTATIKVHRKIDPLAYKVVDAEFSVAKDRIIMVSSSPNQLHVYDPVTQVDQVVALPDVPTSVSVSPDGFYVVVGHNMQVSQFDLTKEPSLLKTFPVNDKVLDIVYSDNGYAYAFPKADGVEGVYSIELSTGKVTVDASTKTRKATLAKLRKVPNKTATALYGAANTVSAAFLEKYDISSGTAKLMTITHSTQDACGNLWMSGDGYSLLTACGTAYKTNDLLSDLDLITTFEGGVLHAFSSLYIENKIFTIHQAAAGNGDTYIEDYSTDFYVSGETPVALPAFIVNKKAYAGHGRFVFANAEKVFVIMQPDKASGLTDQDGIAILPLSEL